MRKFVFLIVFSALMLTPIVAQDEDAETFTLVTYDSFVLSDEVIAAFEEQADVRLEILRFADAGVMVNQSILSQNNPLGDVMYGVDNTFLSRALDEDLFISYQADGLENVPDEFQLDPENRVTPVTFGDVCLNYDVAYFEENDLEIPTSLADLADSAYESLLVVQNPATSSPGLAFLLATIAEFGDEGDYTYIDYWNALVENDVLITNDWTDAYYGEFSAGSEEGIRPLVVSYASSPPVEVIFAEEEIERAPTGAITADGMCFRQIEFAGILDGTDQPEIAEQFIEFTLMETFQEDLPLNMFVFPVIEDAELPDVFVEFTVIPENPVTLPYERIEENRETWLRDWTREVLR